jgi:hypothetical protein
LVKTYLRIFLRWDQPTGIGQVLRFIQDHAATVAMTDLVALVMGDAILMSWSDPRRLPGDGDQ